MSEPESSNHDVLRPSPGSAGGPVPRWAWWVEALALGWSLAFLVAVEVLLRADEATTVVVTTGRLRHVHLIEHPVIEASGWLPHLPGTLAVGAAVAVLAATAAYRRHGRPRADRVAAGAAAVVLVVALAALLTLGVALLPVVALLLAAAGGMASARQGPPGRPADRGPRAGTSPP